MLTNRNKTLEDKTNGSSAIDFRMHDGTYTGGSCCGTNFESAEWRASGSGSNSRCSALDAVNDGLRRWHRHSRKIYASRKSDFTGAHVDQRSCGHGDVRAAHA